jgi:hypothetical protein
MSLKLKVIGLGLLAAILVSGIAVVNASANGEGHLVSEVTHTEIKGFETETHTGAMIIHGLAGEMVCDENSAVATITTETVVSVTGSATVSKCHTKGSATDIPVHINGCTGTGTIAKGTTENTEQTGHLVCPPGKAVVITHPNCTVTIHPQTNTTGATIKQITNPVTGKHEITGVSNVQFSVTRHGLCQFVAPTLGTGTAIGSATARGFDTEGNQVSITAT